MAKRRRMSEQIKAPKGLGAPTSPERKEKMKGNKLWKLSSGRRGKRKIESADELLRLAEAYWSWCDKNPRLGAELTKFQGVASVDYVPLGQAYSISGFALSMGVSESYIRKMRNDLRERVEDNTATEAEIEMLEAVEYIEGICRQEMVDGALVGQYKESLTARFHSIADNVNNNNTGDATVKVTVRDQETRDNLKALDAML